MVFQDYNLFPNLTAFQNLEIVYDDKEKIDNLMKKFDIYEKKDLYPQNLSGGQQQRLAIMRTLLKNPKIIIYMYIHIHIYIYTTNYTVALSSAIIIVYISSKIILNLWYIAIRRTKEAICNTFVEKFTYMYYNQLKGDDYYATIYYFCTN